MSRVCQQKKLDSNVFLLFFLMMGKRGHSNYYIYIYDTKQDFLALKSIKENKNTVKVDLER